MSLSLRRTFSRFGIVWPSLAIACSVAIACTTTPSSDGDGPSTGTDGGGDGGASSDSGGSDGPSGNTDGGGGPIVRTLVYHELTTGENGGVDTTKGTAFSRDGTLGLYDENAAGGYQPTVVGADGNGRKNLDTVSAGWIDMRTLSDDGSLAAYVTDTMIVSSTGTPSPKPAAAIGNNDSWSRFAKDPADSSKWRIFFQVAVAWAPSHERGVYHVAPDGNGLVSLMTPNQAAVIIGGGITPDQIAPKGTHHALDVSADGKEYVTVWTAGSCTQTGQKDYIISSKTDGSDAKLVMGPITDGCGVDRVGLSGDGTTIAYDVPNSADTNQRDIDVIAFAGSGKKTIATFPGGNDTNFGISDDGKLVVANARLYNADGSGAFDLAVQGGTYSSDPPSGIDFFLGIPNGKADRFLYVSSSASPRRMALLELNPASTGSAPTITAPVVSPASVPVDGSASATLSVKVESAGKVLRVAAAVMKDGAHDDKGFSDLVLLDDGTHGDAVADDGTYTSNELKALSEAKTGARTIRVRATTLDGAGRTHSTVIEFQPFAVN